MKKWIVFANKAACNVFEEDMHGDHVLKFSLDNPNAMEKVSDIYSDKAGRSFGMCENHYMEELNSKFAHEITDRLEKHRHLGEFDQLTIVSGPTFIGDIREALSKPLSMTVKNEIVKNICAHDVKELNKMIKNHKLIGA